MGMPIEMDTRVWDARCRIDPVCGFLCEVRLLECLRTDENAPVPKYRRLIRLRKARHWNELPPILVRRSPTVAGHYTIIDGNNRYILALERGWPVLKAELLLPTDVDPISVRLHAPTPVGRITEREKSGDEETEYSGSR